MKRKPRLEKSKVHVLTVLVTSSSIHEKVHFYLSGLNHLKMMLTPLPPPTPEETDFSHR